ncbi:hypothetical protein GDO86_009275 [Hymenochirus boettgeri]|uniref:Small integral membrane protein 26 n=1 Tax=Hymenochirus boettgeri TaxID=247094 RepID=A0A8T2JFS5_9PIPI|nr:hypothetical protein GDO86_009275 [Hymenochirus boettgeri]
MDFKDFSRWNIRFSVLYAAGIWGAVAAYSYYYLFDKGASRATSVINQQQDSKEELQETLTIPVQPNKPGLNIKSTVTYKENYVPYSTKILNVFMRLPFNSAPVSTANDSKEK